MKNLQRKKGGGFRWKMNLELLHREYHNILAPILTNEPIDVDTLFVYGSKSKYIVPSDIDDIKAIFPMAKFEEMDAGHWIHAEQPEQLLSIIRAYLKA
jgi:pimeloyl-ACP methyl ester carboxylesterase